MRAVDPVEKDRSNCTPQSSLGDAAGEVLGEKFRVLGRLLSRMDSEGPDDQRRVHQLRVATRRGSAALGIFEPGLKRRTLKKARAQLREIRRIASDARQCDVHLNLLNG